MHAEKRPTYIQAALIPQALTLEAFRQTLPVSERFEIFRFFQVQWDIATTSFLLQQSEKRLDVLPVANAAAIAYGLDKPQTFDS